MEKIGNYQHVFELGLITFTTLIMLKSLYTLCMTVYMFHGFTVTYIYALPILNQGSLLVDTLWYCSVI